MIRNFIIAVGIIAAVGMINTTPAQAAMCDNHGVGAGHIYKAACGATTGTGGGGALRPIDMVHPDPCDHTPDATDPTP